MKRKVITITLLIIWMIVIFIFSAMNSNSSDGKSKAMIKTTIKNVLTVTNKFGITDKDLSDSEINSIVDKLNTPLRKFAHATVYLVLAILLMLVLNLYNIDMKKALIITVIICFIYSLTDEYHQTFVKGRSGQFTDCLIDTLGSFLGGSITYIFIRNSLKKNMLKMEESKKIS